MQLDTFTAAYIECALWSSADDDGEPLDRSYDINDFAPATLAQIKNDCAKFQRENVDDFAVGTRNPDRSGDSFYSAGHDFWLTRNGHGAGFWDGDWPEPQATRLDNASKRAGQCDLYVGDDGKLYL